MRASAFIHDHADYDALLSIVSDRVGVSAALVEKDYWVTHTLWTLEADGLRIWFKGGTSLSKGFGLIERFSEDLDLKLDAPDLPRVANWRSEGVATSRTRQKFFAALARRIRIPGADVAELTELRDRSWRNVVFAVRYPGRFANHLPPGVRPFVQLEVGSARVTPGEERAITSWIHVYLAEEAPEVAATMVDNRPRAIHCVLPAVTLVEKIEAISRLYSRDPFEPARFVRHYEDAARILAAGVVVPDHSLRDLLTEMRNVGDIRNWPGEKDPAFNPDADETRWKKLEVSWRAIASIFWGDRIPLRRCATEIRAVVQSLSE